MIRVGILASTLMPIARNTNKGTESFVYRLIQSLKQFKDSEIGTTVFASGDSEVDNLKFIQKQASLNNPNIGSKYNKFFELANTSMAFSNSNIDLFHVNIGNGETIVPFCRYIKKPVLITMHYHLEKKYRRDYFQYFKDLPNVYYISVSNSQRKPLPFLNYCRTIYHGIDTKNFKFSHTAQDHLLWAGRENPKKGITDVLSVVEKTEKKLIACALVKKKHTKWFDKQISTAQNKGFFKNCLITKDIRRRKLVLYYQSAKLFLNPIKWEEPFGYVMIEAMACGTPIVAYARGSVPEIVKDGVTGFIVNSSVKDKRGNWLIKKTGVEGLVEAVNRIYNMPKEEYQQMRLNCRQHVEENFTVEKMVKEYIEVYKEIIAQTKKN